MAPRETTTIEIPTDARRRLRVWKAARDMTYDEAIHALLDAHEDAADETTGERA